MDIDIRVDKFIAKKMKTIANLKIRMLLFIINSCLDFIKYDKHQNYLGNVV